MQWKALIPILAGVLSAVRIDFSAYKSVLESWNGEDPKPHFRWELMCFRALEGAAVATLGIVGYESV